MIDPVDPSNPAETVVAAMAREIEDGAVIATGVASPLALPAIAVARATHAPRPPHLASVGGPRPAPGLSRLRGRPRSGDRDAPPLLRGPRLSRRPLRRGDHPRSFRSRPA